MKFLSPENELKTKMKNLCYLDLARVSRGQNRDFRLNFKAMATPFFWCDLEMTGLDENKDSILEIAVILTDLDFNEKELYHRVIYQPPEVLAGMNEWCKEHHGKSGLIDAVPSGTPLATVETELLALVNRYYQGNDRIVLVGNSIGNDRRFIDRYLPEFAKRLHYRMIDVSSFKEIFREKYGLKYEKKNTHRATCDIRESIRELQYYLSFVKV
jgi:oligoribonuclease